MSKILAIDFGIKRTGLAISDHSQTFSFPLTTVNSNELISYLKNLFLKEDISHILIGKPYHCTNKNKPVELENHIIELIKKIKNEFSDKTIIRYDERLTSKMASDVLLFTKTKKKKRQDKSLIDKISATLILQSYLEYKKNFKEVSHNIAEQNF